MVFEGTGKKRTYITISSSSEDDDDDGEEDDPSEKDESEEESDGNEDEYEEVEDVASDSTSSSDNDDDHDGNRTSDDEADDSDDEKSAHHGRNELISNGVICYLREQRDLEELNLEECKSYLRQHGLRITGTKAECIQRIKEHWRIKNGNAEALYPKSSFTINCTGDVCKGDVVLFKQRLHKKSGKMARNGSFIATRTIAGRVVKESYGAARQQHTFTIEVLWSKYYKKIQPLFPLLLKGRNLYRLQTFRQRWNNEAERSIILAEKHKRGAAARSKKKANWAPTINRSTGRRKEKSAKRQKHSSPGPSRMRNKAEPKEGKYGNARGKAPAEFAKPNSRRQKAPPAGRANSERNQNPSHPGDHENYLHQPQMQFPRQQQPILPDRFPRNEADFYPSAMRFRPLRPYAQPHVMPVYQHPGTSHQPYPGPAYFHQPRYVYNEHGSFNQSREPNIYDLPRPFHSQEKYGRRNYRF